jgi:site-specific DNA-methyltransferase (adenine-specific)
MNKLVWPSDFINKIICGDWFEISKKIPSESIDLIATDPPYESLRRWEGIGTTARMGLGRQDSKSYDPNKFFQTIPNSKLPEMMNEFSRILKKDSHCYVMCDAITIPYFFNIMKQGFNCPESCVYFDEIKSPFDNIKPLVWDKEIIGMGYHYRCQYEFILMFDKGKRKLKDLGKPDILKFKKYRGEVPTEKPIRLFELLISQSSEQGNIVLDPFLGSGTTAIASKLNNRNFIGIEINPDYCKIAEERLAQGVL